MTDFIDKKDYDAEERKFLADDRAVKRWFVFIIFTFGAIVGFLANKLIN